MKKIELVSAKKNKPRVINLLANDICNSKCTMCHIWKKKKDFEYSPTQLCKILKDDLFSEVTHVGITGGEPTLRKDLVELYDACIDALPNLKGMSIITNAIQFKQVTQRISKVHNLCKLRNIHFSAMVSLDGLNEVHDQVRGRDGNFDTAIKVMDFLSNQMGTSNVSFGFTITKDNVWNAHTFLDFVESKGYYGRFRIAEYINRLYNNEIPDKIRAFNEEEIYELTTFFMRLVDSYESNVQYQRTYKNIIHMLNGGKRQIGCPYQSKGIVLDSRGDLQYCAPKSAQIGNSLLESAHSIWKNNENEKKRILSEDCQSCIHDYHAPPSFKEQLRIDTANYWKKVLCVEGYEKHRRKVAPLLKWKYGKKQNQSIFISGWYGTETVGDKAIIGGIILEIQKRYPEHEIIISTITNEHVVRRTMDELGVKARIVHTNSTSFVRAALNSEITIMGGGPLMDIGDMAIPLWAFYLAKLNRRKTILWGCGIGPLKMSKYVFATHEILKLSDIIKLRDRESRNLALKICPNKQVTVIDDPSKGYIDSIKRNLTITNDNNQFIAVFIREWPFEYANTIDFEEYLLLRKSFEQKLADFLIEKSTNLGLPLVFYPMHSLSIGGDDREYARKFASNYLEGYDFHIVNSTQSVRDICQAMVNSELNICMRFHSAAFASTLKTKFMAIDYTQKGKILGLLKDRNEMDKYLNMDFQQIESISN